MHKTYVTFGQDHTHAISGKTLDKDSVAVIESKDEESGREMAFELFGNKWCMEYPEKFWNEDSMKHFPRGYIKVN